MQQSIYHHARNDRQYKAATGLSKGQFEALYHLFEPFYEPKKPTPSTTRQQPVLTNKREALFFILHYYKAYPSLQNMGMYFGFSDFAASTYLERLKPCLKATLQAQGLHNTPLFPTQEEFDKKFADVTDLVIDVTEVPIERSSNQEVQREHYSGKKKGDTLKWLVISTLARQILWTSKPYAGRRHDFAIFKEIFAHLHLKKYRIHVDAAFTGIKDFIECGYVFIPFKARKNHSLTPLQKAINHALAPWRVAVENGIATLKSFFILRIENRMRKKEKLADAFTLCAELAYFKSTHLTC